MTERQKAALAKAQAAAKAAARQKASNNSKVASSKSGGSTNSEFMADLCKHVQDLKGMFEAQFKAYNDAMDEIKLKLDDIRHAMPPRLNTSFIKK